MTITINGNGTVTGVSVGGLPDGIVDTDMIAANAVTAPKRGPGAILQVVSTTKTDTWTASVGEGALSAIITGLTTAITPTAASSKILLTGFVTVVNDVGGHWGTGIVLCNGSTEISNARGSSSGSRSLLSGVGETGYRGTCIPLNFLDSPSTTSAITYGIKVWNGHTSSQNLAVNYKNGDDTDDNNHYRATSTLTAMEVAA